MDGGEGAAQELTIRFFPNCRNIIRCLPLLQYDEHRVNDVANSPHELTHAPDALRGFCVYWTARSAGEPTAQRHKLIDRLAPKERAHMRQSGRYLPK